MNTTGFPAESAVLERGLGASRNHRGWLAPQSHGFAGMSKGGVGLPEVIAIMGRRLCIVLAILTAAMTPRAETARAGQQEPDAAPHLFDMSIEQLMEMEVQTVHGASKYNQKVTEAPSSVTIITAEDIQVYGYRTLDEILRGVRGFYTTNDRNYTYLGVRGFGLPGDYNSRILLLVDGFRINDNVYDQAYIGDEFLLDVDLIDRIEIIRGPGSSLYGNSAFFAVINVITKSGKALDGFEGATGLGSYDAFRQRVSYGKEFGNGWDTLLSYTYHREKGPDVYFKEYGNPANNFGWANGCDDAQHSNLFAKLRAGDVTLHAAHVSREKGVPTAAWGTLFNDDRNDTHEKTTNLGLTYQRAFDNGIEAEGRLAFGHNHYGGRYMYPGPISGYDASTGYWVGTSLQLAKQINEQHKLIWGIEYRDDRQQAQDYYDDTGVYLNDERGSDQIGVFIQDEFHVCENVILNMGLRYDSYSTFGGTTNPRFALIYKHTQETILKAIYGTAFRAPSAYEMYYNDGGWSMKTNPSLRPESITTYELILDQYIGHGLWGSVSAFINEIDDLIESVEDPADGLMVFQNTSTVKAKGLEFELSGKLRNGWRTRASYCFVRAENRDTDSLLPNSPRHIGKLNLTVPLPADKFFLGLELQYTGKRRTLTGHHTDGALAANLTIHGEVRPNLDVSVSVYNLFNQRYGHPGFAEHAQEIIYQNGTTFWFDLTYRHK